MRAQVVPRSTTTPTNDKELEKLYESFTRLWSNLNIPFYLRNSLLPDWKTMAGRYLIGELPIAANGGFQTIPLVLPTTN